MKEKKSSIKTIIVGMICLLFTIAMAIYPYISIPNAEKVTAEIVQYKEIIRREDFEETISWKGIYEFRLDNKTYTIKGNSNYRPKSIVPKKVTVYYNPEDYSQHKLSTSPFMVCLGGGIGLIFLINGIHSLKKSY